MQATKCLQKSFKAAPFVPWIPVLQPLVICNAQQLFVLRVEDLASHRGVVVERAWLNAPISGLLRDIEVVYFASLVYFFPPSPHMPKWWPYQSLANVFSSYIAAALLRALVEQRDPIIDLYLLFLSARTLG
jgi:hypothetical protein